jgi:hypothetical protein
MNSAHQRYDMLAKGWIHSFETFSVEKHTPSFAFIPGKYPWWLFFVVFRPYRLKALAVLKAHAVKLFHQHTLYPGLFRRAWASTCTS